MQRLLQAANDNVRMVQEINQGLNDSLALGQTSSSSSSSAGLYQDWSTPFSAFRGVETIYGKPIASSEQKIQTDADTSIAEAISLNNSIYAYGKQMDEVGEDIKAQSHNVSPGGAQKLTAQSMGLMLHAMDQSLRTQATGLKLQAQTLAIENHKDKEETKSFSETSQMLSAAMKTQSARFELPRF